MGLCILTPVIYFVNVLKKEMHNEVNPDIIDKFLGIFCREFAFNPHMSSYTPEKGALYSEWRRQKAAELGCKTYQVSSKKH